MACSQLLLPGAAHLLPDAIPTFNPVICTKLSRPNRENKDCKLLGLQLDTLATRLSACVQICGATLELLLPLLDHFPPVLLLHFLYRPFIVVSCA